MKHKIENLNIDELAECHSNVLDIAQRLLFGDEISSDDRELLDSFVSVYGIERILSDPSSFEPDDRDDEETDDDDAFDDEFFISKRLRLAFDNEEWVELDDDIDLDTYIGHSMEMSKTIDDVSRLADKMAGLRQSYASHDDAKHEMKFCYIEAGLRYILKEYDKAYALYKDYASSSERRYGSRVYETLIDISLKQGNIPDLNDILGVACYSRSCEDSISQCFDYLKFRYDVENELRGGNAFAQMSREKTCKLYLADVFIDYLHSRGSLLAHRIGKQKCLDFSVGAAREFVHELEMDRAGFAKLSDEFVAPSSLVRCWIDDTKVYETLRRNLPNLEIVHHYRPSSRFKFHVDIFLPRWNIGFSVAPMVPLSDDDFVSGARGHNKFVRDRADTISRLVNKTGLLIFDLEASSSESDIVVYVRKILKEAH